MLFPDTECNTMDKVKCRNEKTKQIIENLDYHSGGVNYLNVSAKTGLKLKRLN